MSLALVQEAVKTVCTAILWPAENSMNWTAASILLLKCKISIGNSPNNKHLNSHVNIIL